MLLREALGTSCSPWSEWKKCQLSRVLLHMTVMFILALYWGGFSQLPRWNHAWNDSSHYCGVLKVTEEDSSRGCLKKESVTEEVHTAKGFSTLSNILGNVLCTKWLLKVIEDESMVLINLQFRWVNFIKDVPCLFFFSCRWITLASHFPRVYVIYFSCMRRKMKFIFVFIHAR